MRESRGGGKSILLLGGGVIGLCTAYYAMRAGHRVTVVERGAKDHDGCSLGNAGMIVPSHIVPLAAPGIVATGLRMLFNPESPFALRLRWDADLLRWGQAFLRAANSEHVNRSAPLLRDLNLGSRRCYEELAEERGNDFGLVKKGLLMLCKSEQALHEERLLAERARGLGLPAECLSPEETTRLDPNIGMDIAGSVYFPQDCHLDPRRFLTGLVRELEAGGVSFLWSTEATGWNWNAGTAEIHAVETSRGSLSADEYVLAGGSWSPKLTQSLGIRLPLQPGKGYSLTLASPRQLPTICSILTEARVAATPMGNALRFAGTMEIGAWDLSISPARVRGIIHSVPSYFPGFTADDFRDLPVWRGLRPCSPDGLPYIGRFARFRNVSVATGHAMMGLSLGPITGKLMAEILSEKQPELDITLLRPERFS